MSNLRIVGVSGSLRARSFNTALLRAAAELAPPDVEIAHHARLGELPHYDEELEAAGDPDPVAAWKAALRDAHALLIVTPEYNGSIPGLLKNALDWGSRPSSRTPLRGLPVAVMGATPGALGTVRAQLHLRDTLASIGANVLPAPDVVVARAHERFDADLRLVDAATRELVGDAVARLAGWARLLDRRAA